jgi:hypothetical protein
MMMSEEEVRFSVLLLIACTCAWACEAKVAVGRDYCHCLLFGKGDDNGWKAGRGGGRGAMK